MSHSDSPAVPLATLLADRNLDAMLGVMTARSGGDMRNVERWDLRAAILEVLGWEGIRESAPVHREEGKG